MTKKIRQLHIVLGDQLNLDSTVFDGFDNRWDRVWMAEVPEEATHVWCHRLRLAFFFSAMRHFRDALSGQGRQAIYHELSSDPAEDEGASFRELLGADLRRLGPDKAVVAHPGDWRVKEQIEKAAQEAGVALEIREDRHFYSSPAEFAHWADGRKTLVLENFYRHLRKKHGVLMDAAGKPEGGEWNYDADNRSAFGRQGPPRGLRSPPAFAPDAVTREVIDLVRKRFGNHPGRLEKFDLPVTREDALVWLEDFIRHRLADFGRYQDAMWTGERFLFHSRLSCLLNVKLLDPRETLEAALAAYRQGQAPLNSVEGFVRQILGWREFVRGIYWLHMPAYLGRNHFGADEELPSFFWDGETDMACVRDAMENVLDHGYAHHIQRLMVLGLFAQLYGVNPRKFHEWHLAMYLDAIDWASLPNTLGMSQFGDGGIVGTKPYCATGKYIRRMSNHCGQCRYHPDRATGDDACPFTTLYWDFLSRTYEKIKSNRRMAFQVRNFERKSPAELEKILERAGELRGKFSKKFQR